MLFDLMMNQGIGMVIRIMPRLHSILDFINSRLDYQKANKSSAQYGRREISSVPLSSLPQLPCCRSDSGSRALSWSVESQPLHPETAQWPTVSKRHVWLGAHTLHLRSALAQTPCWPVKSYILINLL